MQQSNIKHQTEVNSVAKLMAVLKFFTDCESWRAWLHDTDCNAGDESDLHPDDRLCQCGGQNRIDQVETIFPVLRDKITTA